MTRLTIVNIFFVFVFLFLTLGLINLEVLHWNNYRELSDKNSIRLLPQEGCRGRILDREGNVIVDNKLSYDAMILPQEPIRIEEILKKLSGVLGENTKELNKIFNRGFIASSVPISVAKDIDVKKAIALEELRWELPGIIIQPKPVRNYPYGNLASHVIGYISEIDHWRLTKLADYGYKTKDIVGFGGLEEKYDYYLRQDEGGLSMQVDHRGRFVRTLGFRPPRNGKDIQLTLNLKLQKLAEDKLADRKGCVVIMDPFSGEIMAMASFPNFDPTVFVNKSNSALSLLDNPDAPLLNRAMSCSYPAGSLFKLIVATAALEEKKINLYSTFVCNGGISIGNKEFKCWSTHQTQSLVFAIAHSCNVFFYRTGMLLGAQQIYDYALKFGLSKTTSFELPYETSGFIPSPLWKKMHRFKSWFDGDTANLSIGQGEVLVTPLQMTRVMAVFANKGYLVTPYVVKGIDGKDISGYQKKITGLSLSRKTIDYVNEGLRAVVQDPEGTGHILSALSVSVAGKTGTAQAPPGISHAWFTGFFPFKNPKFVICVFLERGGPGHASCVVAKEIIESMISEDLI